MPLSWWQSWLAQIAGQDPAKLNKALPATGRLVADVQALRPDILMMLQLYYDKVAPALERMKPNIFAAEKELDNILPAAHDLLKLFGVQIDAGLTTQQAVNNITRAAKLAHPKWTMLNIQKALKLLGFEPGKLDNVYGAQTGDAVETFQRARNLTIDRWPGPETCDRLERDLQEKGITL